MKSKPFVKKIIAGKYKNKVLKLPSKITTRTSKVIVLESFFNTVQFEIIDATFVEVFSGSGSIGLEALSRGASNIMFMERDKEAIKVLKQNIHQADPSACEVFTGDSFTNIKSVVKALEKKEAQAYIYIDPPFSIREGMEDIYDKTISMIASLPQNVVKLIIIEHMTGLELPKNLGLFELKKSKKFGNTTLTYYI